MLLPIVVAAHFVQFQGPDGQRIDINPEEVVSIREPRGNGERFDPDVKCLVITADGKFIGLITDCATVRARLGAQR